MLARNSQRASFQELLEKLKENGCRLTRQREYILETFFEIKDGIHLSAEDVFNIIKNRPETNVSLATVYRSLKALCQIGILREVDLAEDHKHYEISLGEEEPHHHIVCMNCDQTIEFSSPEVDKIAKEVAKSFGIEKILDIELTIRADCSHENQKYKYNSSSPKKEINHKKKKPLKATEENNITLLLPKHRR